MYNLLKRLSMVLLFLAAAVLPLAGQSSTGTVEGNVKDASGAVIPGVEITLTDTATGAKRTAITDDEGRFRIDGVPKGNYHAEAALTGFKTAAADFKMAVAGRQALHFVLQIGQISEVVETVGSVQKVNTQEGTLSNVVEERQVEDLPLNGRNVFQLAALQPGITTSATDGIGGTAGGLNSSGLRSRGNNFSLDGTSNNDPISGGFVQLNPNLDTVAEFRVQNNNFSAEYGRNNGLVINVVTKSGSNQFHGTAYWFHRNDALDAREIFDAEKAPLRQHQAGFTVGGPVIPDRTFFFFGFEALRTFSGESSIGRFETPEFRQLVAQQFPGSTADFLLSRFPGPTPTSGLRDVGSPSGQIAGAGPPDGIPDTGLASFFSPSLFKTYNFNVRVDHEIADNHKIFGRYTWETQSGPPSDIRGAEQADFFDGYAGQGTLADTYIFSPNMVNELRFGYSRNRSDFDAVNRQIADFNIFSFQGGDGIRGFGAYGGEPQFFTGEEYHLTDVVSLNKGDHGMKFGFEYRWNQDDSDFQFLTDGFVGYLGVFDFASNLPYEVSLRVDPRQVGGVPNLVGTPHNFRDSEFGFFFQDDWKVTDRLTLNLGIRYDNFGQVTDTQGRLANIMLGPGADPFQRVSTATVGQVNPDGVFDKDNNNFAPRIGFAWDVFGDGKTSLRGGFGVAYDRLFLNVSGNIRFNPPFSANVGLYPFVLFGDLGISPTAVAQLINSGAQVPFQVPTGLTSAGFNAGGGPALNFVAGNTNALISPVISLRSPDPNLRTSYSMNWFLGIQRETLWDMLVEVNYVGNVGRKLGFIDQFNRFDGDRFGFPNPLTGANAGSRAINRLNPFFSSENLRTNNVNSSFNGGNVSVTKRYSQGLQFQSAFTFGKTLDFGSDNFSSNAGSIFSIEPGRTDLEKGRASFDITKRWVSNFIWEVPWLKNTPGFLGNALGGWQIQGIITFQDGTPFTPQAFSSAFDYNGDGRNNDRPNAPLDTSQFQDPGKQAFINGIFGSTGSASRAVFNPNGAPGDCDGDGAIGGPTGVTSVGGVPCAAVGTLGRGVFRGPGFANTDFSVFKNFRVPWVLQEDAKIQFRAEFFNVFNRVNFAQVNRSFTSSTFGRSTSALDAREIQFALKFIF